MNIKNKGFPFWAEVTFLFEPHCPAVEVTGLWNARAGAALRINYYHYPGGEYIEDAVIEEEHIKRVLSKEEALDMQVLWFLTKNIQKRRIK